MRLEIRHRLPRSRREGFVERTTHVEADTVTFGRGADATIHLSDSRVLLVHASMTFTGDGLRVDAAPGAEIERDGVPVDSATLELGRIISIGPYDIALAETVQDGDAGISITYARPMGDAATLVRNRVRTPLLDRARNGWTTGAIIAVLLLIVGLGLPAARHILSDEGGAATASPAGYQALLAQAEGLWATEPLSLVHRNIEGGCVACHNRPLTPVADTSCISCHEQQGPHVGAGAIIPVSDGHPDIPAAGSCLSCHKEHDGPFGPTPTEAVTVVGCIGCHRDSPVTGDGVTLAAVPSIGGHPAFDAPDTIPTRLRFSHKVHLDPAGMRSPDGPRRILECATCHLPAEDAALKAVKPFEQACGSCHALAFEPKAPDRPVPHGNLDEIIETVRETYEALATAPAVPATAPPRRRLPGATPRAIAPAEPVMSVDAQIAEAMVGPVQGLCAGCHAVEAAPSAVGWRVVPPRVDHHWFTAAEFDHRPHEQVACATCHDSAQSTRADDVSLPKVETCLTCHAPGEAGPTTFRQAGIPKAVKRPAAAATCTTCHDYHGAPPRSAGLTQGHPAAHAWSLPAKVESDADETEQTMRRPALGRLSAILAEFPDDRRN